MSDLKTYVEDRCIPEPNSGCWLWLLSIGSHGYGSATNPSTQKTDVAHRVSYRAYKGPIPEDMTVDHLCRNKLCVNPDHLEAVTFIENRRRQAVSLGHVWCETEEERHLHKRAYDAHRYRERKCSNTSSLHTASAC